MFSYQRNFTEETCVCTPEIWDAVTHDPKVKADRQAATEAYRKYGKGKEYDKLKKKLPLVIFPCTFEPNHGGKGESPEGLWRCQAGVRLNGLFMYDADELQKKHGITPEELYNRIPDWLFDPKEICHIKGAHKTPSGDGLRLIGTCDPEKGNLADHQQWLASILGVPCDKSVKDASRGSFMVDDEMILYLDKSIFTYNDETYDKKWGDYYRRGRTSPGASPKASPSPSEGGDVGYPEDNEGQPAILTPPPSEGLGEALYHDVPYQKIVEVYCARYPDYTSGDRHEHLKVMAGRLRYIVDNSPAKLKQLVRLADYVQKWESAEHNKKEIDDLCDGACSLKFYASKPKMVKDILQRAGVKLSEADNEASKAVADSVMVAQETFAARLKPLMAEPYKTVCQGIDERNHIPAIFASGTMFCTLMSRCWYQHYTGNDQRMNPQAEIIGDPASGKSFVEELDGWIMAALKAEDEAARKAEKKYKDEQRERSTSSKAQKGDALKRPELPIRYLTTNTSNNVFFRRLSNAKEIVDGEVLPLHLYMFDSELASANKRNGGADWIGKRDLELKAFHNETTGVDYANNDSINEILKVFWNSVTTGTKIALGKKFTLANINDGLCTRIAIAPMVSDHFQMMERGDYKKYCDRRAALISWGYRFNELKGELRIAKLIDHVYNLCAASAKQAKLEDNLVLDTLRRRAVFYATWFTIPRIVARAMTEKPKRRGKKAEVEPETSNPLERIKVANDDLQFATLIYDAIIYWQDAFFGQMLLDSWENGERQFAPRVRTTENAQKYALLGDEFSFKQVKEILNLTPSAANNQTSRWVSSGYIERSGRGKYRKLIRAII